MPYQTKNQQTNGRIANEENWEIKYWAQMLGCSEAELVPAVKAMFHKPSASKNGMGNQGNLKRKSR
jgi:hypothetical protein